MQFGATHAVPMSLLIGMHGTEDNVPHLMMMKLLTDQ